MRCLALAKVLADSGATCIFFSRAHQGNLNYLIENFGFNVVSLTLGHDVPPLKSGSTAHAAWLGVTLADELLEMQHALKNNPVDIMIVDHYALDAEWERSVREFCPLINTLAVIDDLADRQHYADVLVDQNVVNQIADYQPLVQPSTVLLLGTQYAILRDEFLSWRQNSLDYREKNLSLRSVAVSLGGVDKNNDTRKVLEALYHFAQTEPSELQRITVILGALSPWVDDIKQIAMRAPVETEVKVGINNVAETMSEIDFVFGAAGTSTWERCALGVPSALLVLAENQKKMAYLLRDMGVSALIEPDRIHTAVCDTMRQFNSQPLLTQQMSRKCAEMVDAFGARRVAQEIMARS